MSHGNSIDLNRPAVLTVHPTGCALHNITDAHWLHPLAGA
ncbi:hypothetical protein XA26_10730 [Mycolicibacterium fortuitum]|uniref:Uncharacterized protein n=1 Tax=Mycolicibacterium fortuitum TaxID=1766 RepID=A0A0N9X925_MYCFO|nr:hypothetical protein XA26_10730 [Mycolicibacterium fortuitum]